MSETDKLGQPRCEKMGQQTGKGVLHAVLSVLSCLVLALFGCALLLGVLVPVYTDEVATKLLQARFFDEGGVLVSLLPQCKSSFVSEMPLTWYPAGVVNATIYSALGPLGLRLAGIAVALACVATQSYWAFRVVDNKMNRLHLVATLAALNGFGVMPFVLILARPEQVMLLCLLWYCILPVFFNLDELREPVARSAVVVGFLILSSVFFFAHPKALFFTPLVLVSAFYAAQPRHWRSLSILVLFVVATAYQSYEHANSTARCDEAPLAKQALALNVLDLGSLSRDPRSFFLDGAENAAHAPERIVHRILFQDSYQSGWLPAAASGSLIPLGHVINGLTLVALQSLLYATPILLLLATYRASTQGTFTASTALALALGVGLGAHAFFYSTWHFYNPGLMIPAAFLLYVLVVFAKPLEMLKKSWVSLCLVLVMTLSVANLAFLLVDLIPRLIGIAQRPDDVIPGQPLSVPVFGFDSRRERIRTLGERCNIGGDGAHRLVVDDLTYYAFNRLKQPINVVYLAEVGFGADLAGKKIIPFLEELDSPGIVSRCTYLPTALRDQAIREGDLCCVAAGVLSRF